MFFLNLAPVAQLMEYLTRDQKVLDSNPSWSRFFPDLCLSLYSNTYQHGGWLFRLLSCICIAATYMYMYMLHITYMYMQRVGHINWIFCICATHICSFSIYICMYAIYKFCEVRAYIHVHSLHVHIYMCTKYIHT